MVENQLPASSPGTDPRNLSESPRPSTRAVRAGLESDRQHGAVVPPIHLSSTFAFAGFDAPRRYDYTRSGNPTRDLLAAALADAEGGASAVVTSSGMSAVHLALQLTAPGDLVVAPRDCYGGTYRLLTAASRKNAFRVAFIDPTDAAELRAALDARLRVHQENAAAVVELLAVHPAVTRVYYPGLPEHPGHEIARAQQDGFGAMVSFELAGGGEATAPVAAFLDGLTCFSLAESLGGVESLVAHPATMTHAAMEAEARRRAGISDALLRLSIGIEAAEDLVRDVAAGLDRALAVAGPRPGAPSASCFATVAACGS